MSQCQLCLSTEDVAVLDDEFVPILAKVCELPGNSSTFACMDCVIFIYQIKVFIEKVRTASESLRVFAADDPPELIEILYEEEVRSEEKSSPPATRKLQQPSISEDPQIYTFKCHICDIPAFNKMFQLSAHTRSKHNCLPQVKCCCDKILSTMRSLQRHQAKHFQNPNDIRCSDCQKTFKTENGLKIHFEKSHGPNQRKFTCSQCDRNFCNSRVLERHELTHQFPPEERRNYECQDCGKKFISSDAKKNHIAKFHKKVLSFYCDVCSKGFYTRKSLVSHSESHKPHESISCDLCNRIFKTNQYMQKHRTSHFASSLGEFTCDICHKEFRKKNQIRLHMLVHSEVAAYTCGICDRSFKKKSYLNSHLTIHTGEKKHRCLFCDRSFANPGNCRKHKLRDHSEQLADYESKYGKKGVSNELYLNL